jgi:hypothetical protein
MAGDKYTVILPTYNERKVSSPSMMPMAYRPSMKQFLSNLNIFRVG